MLGTFFTIGKVSTRMAKIFYGLLECNKELQKDHSCEDIAAIIYLMSYSLTRGINDKLEKYDIPLNHKLYVSGYGFKTVAVLSAMVLAGMHEKILELSLEDDVTEIMEKGPLYYHVEQLQSKEAFVHLDY